MSYIQSLQTQDNQEDWIGNEPEEKKEDTRDYYQEEREDSL